MTHTVEIDTSDFSNYDLIDEIEYRANKATGRNAFTESDKKKISIALKEAFKIKKTSLNDQTKIDFFNENFDKISLEDLEKLIK